MQIHYIYRITCLVTQRYYIGLHTTDNVDDGYMGSGKHVRASIQKHGLSNHVKTIIEFLPTREALKLREAELVTAELLQDPLCMNMQLGGGPGFDFVNSKRLRWNSQRRAEHSAFMKAKVLSGQMNLHPERAFKGRTHTDETKRLLSEAGKRQVKLDPTVKQRRLKDMAEQPVERGYISKLAKLWGITPSKASKFITKNSA